MFALLDLRAGQSGGGEAEDTCSLVLLFITSL